VTNGVVTGTPGVDAGSWPDIQPAASAMATQSVNIKGYFIPLLLKIQDNYCFSGKNTWGLQMDRWGRIWHLILF
jgi:hypothetical protein